MDCTCGDVYQVQLRPQHEEVKLHDTDRVCVQRKESVCKVEESRQDKQEHLIKDGTPDAAKGLS